jgi:hypothetical protein
MAFTDVTSDQRAVLNHVCTLLLPQTPSYKAPLLLLAIGFAEFVFENQHLFAH